MSGIVDVTSLRAELRRLKVKEAVSDETRTEKALLLIAETHIEILEAMVESNASQKETNKLLKALSFGHGGNGG